MNGIAPSGAQTLLGPALVVDDDPTSRLVLERMLLAEGYQVLAAINGGDAVGQFAAASPGLVFLDVMLPDIDGYEVARQIRELAGDRYVPLVFLSSLSEGEALTRCIAAGGDDFLSKPCRREVLRAKLTAIERTRRLYERARRQNDELNLLHDRMQRDQEIAEQVFSAAVMADNAASDLLQTLLRSADTFNGDIMLSAPTPQGGLCVLLGDFTGHGLAAAIGALPLSQTFHAMVGKGFGMQEVLTEINAKLRHLLPTGMFMAGCLVRLEPDLSHATIWNSGMPDVLIRDGASGALRARVPSQHPPLGVLPRFLPGVAPLSLEIANGDTILLCSDGVTEASDPGGELFGEARLEAAVCDAPADAIFARVTASLDAFTRGAHQDDDISLVVIPCQPALFGRRPQGGEGTPGLPTTSWAWSLRLEADSLRSTDPLPLAIGHLAAMGIPEAHRQPLFMILAELFSNALEHGLLGLDSCLKHETDGFVAYYAQREQALAALADGAITLSLACRQEDGQAVIVLGMTDTGPGFDVDGLERATAGGRLPCGRGIQVVRGLCRSLVFLDQGRRVEARYVL